MTSTITTVMRILKDLDWLLPSVRESIQRERRTMHLLGMAYPETVQQAEIMVSLFGRYPELLPEDEIDSAINMINELGRSQGLFD